MISDLRLKLRKILDKAEEIVIRKSKIKNNLVFVLI